MKTLSLVLRCAALLGVLLSGGAGAKTAALPVIRYDVERRTDGGVDRFVITLRFKGDASGRTELHVPGEWASARAAAGISGIEVVDRDARLEDTDDAASKRVIHLPGATVRVRYTLRQIADGDPTATAPTQFLPVIRHGYFEFIGRTAWVTPYASDCIVQVHATFRGLPSNWAFASSFGLDPADVSFTGTLDAFQGALFIGGDFRLRSRPALGGSVITAIRGDWSFRDSELADRIARIVDAERTFWHDDTQRFYLVALLPLTAASGSRYLAGTGLSQSFVTWGTPTPIEELDFLWTHEYFHNWNNPQLGQFPEPQARMYWFSEGFTDYYMNLIQLRLGLMTLDQYAAAYDEVLRSLTALAENHLSNDEVAARFFSDPQGAGRLPYWRGMLLAARWNAEIVAHSGGAGSLDDAMRTLHAQFRAGTTILDTARIVDVMRADGVGDAAGDLARDIDQGALPHLGAGTLGHCITIDDRVDRRSDLGFDRAASEQSATFKDVRIDGPAYAAGIRETQQLRSLSTFGRGRPVEVGFTEPPDQTIRIVRYLAVGQPFHRQSAAMKPALDEAARAHCLQAFGVPGNRPVPSSLPSTACP